MEFTKQLTRYIRSTTVDLMLFKASLDDTRSPIKVTFILGVLSSVLIVAQQLIDDKSIVAAFLSLALWLAMVFAASKIDADKWNKIANSMFLVSMVLSSSLMINAWLGNNQDAVLIISFWCALAVLKVVINSIHKAVSNGFN